jgi:hypothetical protein
LRAFVRSMLAGLLIAAMCDLPVLAAPLTAKPLGTVILSEGGHLDNADAAVGASVFSGDDVATSTGGRLRLRLGTAQVYLLSNSYASMSDSGAASVNLKAGSVGFASPDAEVVEVRLRPDVAVRSKGPAPSNGQITLVSPNEFLVSSYHGALEVAVGDEVTTVAAPNAYRVMLDPQTAEGAGTKGQKQAGEIPVIRKRRALFYAIVLGGAAVGSYLIYRALCESSSTPAQQ